MVQAAQRQSSFSIWLRTGLWPVEDAEGGIETKYNHWHDERDGRFTVSGVGRHDGSWQGGGFTGGGGGSGGGAGATARWRRGGGAAAAGSRTSGSPLDEGYRPAGMRALSTVIVTAPSRAARAPAVAPAGAGRIEVRNGYSFRIDGEGRTEKVSGAITLGASRRSRTAQAAAGGPDRLPKDDGGHYIAVRFKGPADAFNHFAQDANFNRGAYRALEDEWARDVRGDKAVKVTITPSYLDHSKRPATIRIVYTVGQTRKKATFSNERQKGTHSGR